MWKLVEKMRHWDNGTVPNIEMMRGIVSGGKLDMEALMGACRMVLEGEWIVPVRVIVPLMWEALENTAGDFPTRAMRRLGLRQLKREFFGNGEFYPAGPINNETGKYEFGPLVHAAVAVQYMAQEDNLQMMYVRAQVALSKLKEAMGFTMPDEDNDYRQYRINGRSWSNQVKVVSGLPAMYMIQKRFRPWEKKFGQVEYVWIRGLRRMVDIDTITEAVEADHAALVASFEQPQYYGNEMVTRVVDGIKPSAREYAENEFERIMAMLASGDYTIADAVTVVCEQGLAPRDIWDVRVHVGV